MHLIEKRGCVGQMVSADAEIIGDLRVLRKDKVSSASCRVVVCLSAGSGPEDDV